MPFLISFPIESKIIDSTYSIVVDAFFGFSFKGPVKAPFIDALEHLKNIKIPLCSIDIPSGWDVEAGLRLLRLLIFRLKILILCFKVILKV